MPPRPSEHHQFDYGASAWVLNHDRAWSSARKQRDARLAKSDWVVLRAADLGVPVSQEWLDYRQALRDITNQQDPLSIVWPTAPTD